MMTEATDFFSAPKDLDLSKETIESSSSITEKAI